MRGMRILAILAHTRVQFIDFFSVHSFPSIFANRVIFTLYKEYQQLLKTNVTKTVTKNYAVTVD